MAKLAGTQQDAKAFLDGMKRDREPATVAAVAAQELQPQVQTLAVVWAHYKRPIQAIAGACVCVCVCVCLSVCLSACVCVSVCLCVCLCVVNHAAQTHLCYLPTCIAGAIAVILLAVFLKMFV